MPNFLSCSLFTSPAPCFCIPSFLHVSPAFSQGTGERSKIFGTDVFLSAEDFKLLNKGGRKGLDGCAACEYLENGDAAVILPDATAGSAWA